MGLHTGSGSNAIFLNVSRGKFRNKEKQIEAWAVTGKLAGIKFKADTFENQPISKVEVIMKDVDETFIISFTEESYYALGFFSRLANEMLDILKPFTLGVMESEQNEKISFCYIKQGETKITPQPDFPKPEKITTGGRGNAKTVTNWSKCQARYTVLVNEVQGILSAASPEKIEGTANKYSTQGTAQQEPDDDLPF